MRTQSVLAQPTTSVVSPASLEPLGAQVVPGGQTRFRLFSDQARACQVRLLHEDESPRSTHSLTSTGDGYWEATVAGARHGTLYDVVLDGTRLPDPYARFLPRGVHGPAMVVENAYSWRNGPGIYRPMAEQVIYEIHVGTFTREGTYAAARARLESLVELGVTSLELMPLSAFPGGRGWGYDGVAHFAPFAGYGTPDELRNLIDEAHALGLSVLLDVVYNHFGPSGNYLRSFSPEYFSSDTKNAWGDGPNFSHPVMRNYVLANAAYWLSDFRFDGLRLDATHAVIDRSPTHILKEVADLAHGLSPRKIVIAEDERNDPDLILRLGLDGVWADDFHHVAHVTLTEERDGYYANFFPGADNLARTIARGWLYEGQICPSNGKPRGKPATDLPAEAFVYCLQNHDQVGNRAFGDRLSIANGIRPYCALSTVFLFLPMTPLLFMGQEWGATTPFQFFTDHDEELGRLVSAGRREEFKHFQAFADPQARERIPDPQAKSTFANSKLDWREREQGDHARVLALYKALLRLRRFDPVLQHASRDALTVDIRRGLLVIGRMAGDSERVLIANLSDESVSAEVMGAELGGRSVLLRSDLVEGDSGPLPEWTAVIATGRVA